MCSRPTFRVLREFRNSEEDLTADDADFRNSEEDLPRMTQITRIKEDLKSRLNFLDLLHLRDLRLILRRARRHSIFGKR